MLFTQEEMERAMNDVNVNNMSINESARIHSKKDPCRLFKMVGGCQIKWVIQQLTTKASLIIFILCNPFEH